MSRGIIDKLEKLLLEYNEKDDGFIIKLADIMDILEFEMAAEINSNEDSKVRLDSFCDILLKSPFGAALTLKCVINLINLLFQKQVEYHGMYVIAANEIINSDKFVDRNNYFNSAYISEIPKREYFANLIRCKKIWSELARPLEEELDLCLFPYPW